MKGSYAVPIAILVIIIAAGIALVATRPAQAETIKLGFLGPLTGDAAVYGLPLKNMVELAAEEINSQGGIDGKKLEIIYEDGKCSGKDAATAMQKLVDVDKVKVVLGGFCSSESLGAEPIATQNKVFLFSLGSSSPALTDKSKFFARDYPSDATQGSVLAEASYKTKGWRKVAFVQEQLDYPVGIYNAFSIHFKALGGDVIKEEFAPGTTDFRSVLTKLKNENADALFIDTQTPAAADRVLKQLQELNWKPNILISDAVSGDPETIQKNAAVLEGALAAEFGIDENNPKFVHMLDAYKKKFGAEPPYLSYAQTEYDGLFIIRDAIKAVGYDGEKIAEFVRNLKDWQGASGSVSIAANGDRAGGHVPKIVRNGKVVLLGAGQQKIKLGLSAPLTGEAASYGEAVLGGAELAVKEINDAGGVNGKLIELIAEDDKCSSEGVNVFNKLVSIDTVTAIVGPVCSAAGGPALPIAQQAGVPTIEFGSAPHLPKIGDYIFRNYPSDAFQGKFVAEYIFNSMKKTKVAVIYVQNDWGKGINDVFVARFRELGGQVVYDDSVTQESRDLRTVIAKAKAANPEVIYFPVYPGNGAAGLKQMKELGITVPIIGGDAFDGDEVIKAEGAEGVLYTIGKINNPEEFSARVKSITGRSTNSFTPIAYDAVKILAEVMKESGADRVAIKNALNKVSYKGVSFPIIEFDADGDLKQAEFEVRIIRNGSSVPYSG